MYTTTNWIVDTFILRVASKQLRLLRGRVGDSTTLVTSLSPQMIVSQENFPRDAQNQGV